MTWKKWVRWESKSRYKLINIDIVSRDVQVYRFYCNPWWNILMPSIPAPTVSITVITTVFRGHRGYRTALPVFISDSILIRHKRSTFLLVTQWQSNHSRASRYSYFCLALATAVMTCYANISKSTYWSDASLLGWVATLSEREHEFYMTDTVTEVTFFHKGQLQLCPWGLLVGVCRGADCVSGF